MRSKELGKTLLHASEGLVSTATDLILFLTILPFALPGAYTQGEASRRIEDVIDLVSHDLNYRTIKNTVRKLIAAGLVVRRTKRSALDIAITKLGKKRLASLIPTYHENRPWDGHMYLVSYDIPAKPKRKRDMIREYLRRIGAVLLQESLWLTPYNPRDLVDDFIREKEIGGSILLSKLGTDGAIGDESLLDLIRRVYRLDALNERYAAFLETWENKKSRRFSFQATTAYLSILNDDPQLPFPLLPRDFLGTKAYQVYKSLAIPTS